MQPLFICYTQCGTCRRAAKWLQEHNIDVEVRDIVTQNPTKEELSTWIAASGKTASKFFNTSGLRYKELKMKNIVKTAPEDELITNLASDGMLVKRPILVMGQTVLVGFNEEEWAKDITFKD